MKLEELMIGDWVKIKDYPMIPEPRKMCAEYYSRSLVDIEPIPLTEEILKANGFEANSFNGTVFFSRPEFQINSNMMISVGQSNFELKYVHELQHALRLCGLNDLADNFKIK